MFHVFFSVVTIFESDFSYEALRHEIQGLLSVTGKLWIGGLYAHWDELGHRVQDRQIRRLGVLRQSEHGVLGFLAQLVESESYEAEVFGEKGGTEWMSGIVIRPFYDFEVDGIEIENQTVGLIVDKVNDDGWLRAYPCHGHYDTWRRVRVHEDQETGELSFVHD